MNQLELEGVVRKKRQSVRSIPAWYNTVGFFVLKWFSAVLGLSILLGLLGGDWRGMLFASSILLTITTLTLLGLSFLFYKFEDVLG